MKLIPGVSFAFLAGDDFGGLAAALLTPFDALPGDVFAPSGMIRKDLMISGIRRTGFSPDFLPFLVVEPFLESGNQCLIYYRCLNLFQHMLRLGVMNDPRTLMYIPRYPESPDNGD